MRNGDVHRESYLADLSVYTLRSAGGHVLECWYRPSMCAYIALSATDSTACGLSGCIWILEVQKCIIYVFNTACSPNRAFPRAESRMNPRRLSVSSIVLDVSADINYLRACKSTYRDDSSPLYVTSLSGAIDKAVPGRNMMRATKASAII